MSEDTLDKQGYSPNTNLYPQFVYSKNSIGQKLDLFVLIWFFCFRLDFALAIPIPPPGIVTSLRSFGSSIFTWIILQFLNFCAGTKLIEEPKVSKKVSQLKSLVRKSVKKLIFD